MADAIFGLVGQILAQMGSDAVKEIGSAIGVRKELKKLEKTLSTIKAVFRDADEQQLNSHELTDWFKLIKDAMYEAVDIIDDFATEALHQKLKIQESSMKKVRRLAYFFKSTPLHVMMSHRIKQVREKFDEIANDKDKLHLITSGSCKRVDNAERVQTHSFVVAEEVYGREGDKDDILKLLSDVGGESVVAIVGMGGLGKTTLAGLVYNDKAVNSKFETKMWVSVSQEFDVRKITEKMIKSITEKECPNLEMDQLQSRLREKLKGRKYLLVLDDVWNEDSEKWDKLKLLLSTGAKESKVVVTTRSTKVASIMRAKSYLLGVISDKDCWNLFKQRAFAKEEETQSNLVTIGKEMVNKCGGVPLAAKTLGSLMRFKTQEHEWVSVNNSDVWRLPQEENDILPALRLSYNHLPYYLKQCFAYCAVFSKEDWFEPTNLIESWIAHGFVHSSNKNQCLEDIGNAYVKELLWRSLFSEAEEDDHGNITSFKVHDLVLNLAKDVGGRDFFVSEDTADVPNDVEIRYMNLYNCQPSLALEVVPKMKNLRTLVLGTEFPPDDIFTTFSCLRELAVNVVSGSLPSSIGRLRHLRMLLLESFVIDTLPDTITELLNLQTLDIQGCPKLKELPKNIGRMINLRHIHIAEDAPISYMPPGLKNLTSLHTLALFVVCREIGCNLNELKGLVHLKGQLTIKNLQNVSRARDCANANLKQKQKLEVLKLIWNDEEGEGNDENHVSVLETLQPPLNLKEIVLEGYGSRKFPGWTMKPVFPNLKLITLVKCRKCERLPPFGKLPSLVYLRLEDMDALCCIEGHGTSHRRQTEWFPSLKQLYLKGIPNLESWILGEENFMSLSLPCVDSLTIIDCPKLRNMPLLPCLEVLILGGCSEKLVHALLTHPNSPHASLKGLTRLHTLVIAECPELVSLPEEVLECLTSLQIVELPKLVTLPHWVQNANKLQILWIYGCDGLAHLQSSFGELVSLRSLAIDRCSNLQSLPDGIEQLTALESLSIDCKHLMSWPKGLENLMSLEILHINACSSDLLYLPEQLQQLTGLRELGIEAFQTLQTLPEYIKNFTSLQVLSVKMCHNLQCLPEWMPTLMSLQKLSINDCEQLTSRCKEGTGEDWHKIAHIPIIWLNDEIIQDK